MRKIVLLFVLSLINSTMIYSQSPCPEVPTVTYQGKTYNTVQIGTQCWIKENLNVGTMINVNQDAINNGIIEKYCRGNDSANCVIYGGLYQWAEVVQYKNGATNTTSASPTLTGNVRGICPVGWHLPSSAEFKTLDATVNGSGNALLAIGQGTGSGAGTNLSGFSALLAGYRSAGGYFTNLSSCTIFWSFTEGVASGAYQMDLFYGPTSIDISGSDKRKGHSVRCIKDGGGTAVEENNEEGFASEYSLFQNYPNPFNPETVISYQLASPSTSRSGLPVASYVTLKVYDILGKEVAILVNEFKQPGVYNSTFSTLRSSLTSGVYFYTLKAGSFSSTKKMLLIK